MEAGGGGEGVLKETGQREDEAGHASQRRTQGREAKAVHCARGTKNPPVSSTTLLCFPFCALLSTRLGKALKVSVPTTDMDRTFMSVPEAVPGTQ